MPEYRGPDRRRRPREKTKKLETYVSPEFDEAFRAAVAREGMNASHVIRQLCRQWLKARGIALI